MEKEWEKFRDIVMECTNDECGMRRVGGQRRNGSELWNEEVGRAEAEKRRAFEEWLHRRDRVTYDRYRVQRVVVKRAVKVVKRMADRRWRERLGNEKRWSEYFEQVLNVADVREANVNVVGNWRMPVLGDLNERGISL